MLLTVPHESSSTVDVRSGASKMEHIKPPPEMDFASSDGTSVAETWRKWRQSMELFLTLAMTGKTEREQCSASSTLSVQQGETFTTRSTFQIKTKTR